MTVDFEKLRAVFNAAVERHTPGEWDAYLNEACAGDEELRRQAALLLKAHAEGQGPLDREAFGQRTAPYPAIMERPGTVIGPYKLLEQIGEGGFGVVYMAEQQQPVRRKVALKVLKPGMDTKQVVARFEAERQALALMDHTNIARVLDAGTTDSGHPYFVMELVRGIPITQSCDENRLTPRERLELFVTVCQAVQHAHQKGVIHRDLKPSNVLATLQDGTPIAKVIDFGIAKALGQERLTDKTLFTGFAQMIGSPLYMSPEQAEMSGQDADTRTDIYSLGVLLYELLTGTTPFEKERLKHASYDEIRRIIREEEPAKPSTRISTLGQAATTVSADRKSEPRRLRQLFRGDLDWIVMKALEKDRNRRYDTASSLAADLHRYLCDEPVLACPPSAAYRFRKFARRNKAALITASAIASVVLLAVAGLATSTTIIWQANKELRLERGHARRLLYSSELNVAQQAWEEGNFAWARELLERQLPRADEEDLRGFEWRYLWRLCQDESLHTFIGHTAAITAVRFSPDGTMLASASRDGTIRLWDIAGQRSIITLDRHEAAVTSLAFSPNGKILATASDDGRVDLWDVVSRRQVHILPQRAESKDIAFTPDGKILASAGDGGPIELWDVGTAQRLKPLPGPASWWIRVAISPDGQTLAAGNDDTTVRLWDLATREKRPILDGHQAFVIDVAFSPDSKMLASAGNDSTVRLWNVGTREVIHTLGGHSAPVNAVAFFPDGKTFVTGSADSTIRVWDTATWQQVRILRGHTTAITAVAASPAGTTLVTGSGDGLVKVWSIASQAAPDVFPAHERWIHSVAFSPDGKILASAGWFDQTINLWDVASLQRVASLTGHQGTGNLSVKFTADGRTLVSGSGGDKAIRFWDIATQRQVAPPCTHTAAVESISVSLDGRLMAAGGSDGTVVLWDIATGRVRAPLSGRMPAFSPDNKTLAVGCADGTPRLHDLLTGHVVDFETDSPEQAPEILRGFTVETATMKASAVGALAFAPDGQTLAVATDRIVRLWNIATRRRVTILRGHTDHIWSVAFSPDSKTLATCSRDGTVKLWSLTLSQQVVTLKGHRGQVAAVAFAPDGNLLATAGSDGTIRLWRALSAKSPATRQERSLPADGQMITAPRSISTAKEFTSTQNAGHDSEGRAAREAMQPSDLLTAQHRPGGWSARLGRRPCKPTADRVIE